MKKIYIIPTIIIESVEQDCLLQPLSRGQEQSGSGTGGTSTSTPEGSDIPVDNNEEGKDVDFAKGGTGFTWDDSDW